eukprot:s49_g54.t1
MFKVDGAKIRRIQTCNGCFLTRRAAKKIQKVKNTILHHRERTITVARCEDICRKKCLLVLRNVVCTGQDGTAIAMGTLKGLCLIQWLLVVLAGWSRVQDLGVRPSGRSVHVATFHASANEFWIHGGSHGDFSEELWAFDFDTGSWEQRQLNQGPMARGDHVAVWDPNGDVLWIHGGYDGVHYFNDLWRYSSSTWTNIMAPGPSARSQHVAVWDGSNLAIWIHGGLFDCTLNQDLWKFDTQQGTQPFARANHVAVWDEFGQAIWIHAGYNRSCGEVQGGLQQDLWRYDTTVNRNNWNLIAMGGPSARAFHVAGWDPTNRAIWIHGGFDGGPITAV